MQVTHAATPARATTTHADPDPVRDAIADGKLDRRERTMFAHGAKTDEVDAAQDRLTTALRENAASTKEAPSTRREHEALEQRIADERSLTGALDAERVSLESGSPDAADDYQALREEAQPWIEQFNASEGQYYEGNDLFGDDWDASEVSFDRLAERFAQKPELLDDFTRVQGRNDDSLGDDPQAHIADVAEDDPDEARQIGARLEAAEHLQSIMERYLVARGGTEAAQPRIDAIIDQQTDLQGDLERDTALLEASTADLTPDPVVRPRRDEEPVVEPVAPAAPAAPAPPTDAQLLDAAADAGIIDPGARARFSFAESGELVYAAQPGDGYWQAAEHVRPPVGQDFGQHWMATWNQNSSRRYGRPDEQLVTIDQPVTFPGYTRESLLAELDSDA
jgi:hypothetical protein